MFSILLPLQPYNKLPARWCSLNARRANRLSHYHTSIMLAVCTEHTPRREPALLMPILVVSDRLVIMLAMVFVLSSWTPAGHAARLFEAKQTSYPGTRLVSGPLSLGPQRAHRLTDDDFEKAESGTYRPVSSQGDRKRSTLQVGRGLQQDSSLSAAVQGADDIEAMPLPADGSQRCVLCMLKNDNRYIRCYSDGVCAYIM